MTPQRQPTSTAHNAAMMPLQDAEVRRPWATTAPDVVLLLQLPKALHETETCKLPLDEAGLQWRVSVWGGGASASSTTPNNAQQQQQGQQPEQRRLTEDFLAPLLVTQGSNATRVARFVIKGDDVASTISLQVQIVDGANTIGYASAHLDASGRLAAEGDDEGASSTYGADADDEAVLAFGSASMHGGDDMGMDEGAAGGIFGATLRGSTVAKSTTVVRLPHLHTVSIAIPVFSSETDALQLLAPFAATLALERRPLPLPRTTAVPAMRLTGLDVLPPGRSSLYVSLSHLLDAHVPRPDSEFTLLVVLSRGNGDLAIGPQVRKQTKTSNT